MQTRPDVVLRAVLAAFVVAAAPASVFGQPAPASAQNPPATPPAQPVPATPVPTTGQAPTAPASQAPPIVEVKGPGPTKRLTIDEAVQTALEQNLDVQVARVDPQLAALDVDVTRGAWLPQLSGSMRFTNSDQVPNSFLSGAEDTLTSRTFFGTVGLDQVLPKFGTSYSIGWDAQRQTSNNTFSSFNPSLTSSFSFGLTQPLLRGFKIDGNRANFLVSKKNQEITDVQLQQQIIATSRAVRIAYWNLVGTRYALGVSQASLDIARQSLRDNRTRVEVGTMAPIDVVLAEAEVARNEEATIVAASLIDEAEDQLRTLLYDPKDPNFWTMNLELSDAPQLPTSKSDVDVEAAVNKALSNRTDLVAARKQLEAQQITLSYYKDQTKPVVNGVASYGLNAQGGVQIERAPVDPNDPTAPRPPGNTIERPFGSVLGDLFGFDFPTWTLGVQVVVPLGNSTQKANYARNKLAYTQQEMTLRSRELGVASDVRTAARNVNTNRKRIDSTTAARVLSERQLDAASKKFAVGLAQSIDVLTAQRDLASARYSELSAIIDYVKSVVEFQAVQEGATGANLGVTAVTGVPGLTR